MRYAGKSRQRGGSGLLPSTGALPQPPAHSHWEFSDLGRKSRGERMKAGRIRVAGSRGGRVAALGRALSFPSTQSSPAPCLGWRVVQQGKYRPCTWIPATLLGETHSFCSWLWVPLIKARNQGLLYTFKIPEAQPRAPRH